LKSAQYYHLKNFQETKMCFHKLSEKSSMPTHNLATDKLKDQSKNHKKKQVCKMSAKNLHIQQQVCKNKKKHVLKKSAKSLHNQKKRKKQVC